MIMHLLITTEKKSSGCSLKNINLTLTLLHKICSICACPLSNIWHVFSGRAAGISGTVVNPAKCCVTYRFITPGSHFLLWSFLKIQGLFIQKNDQTIYYIIV